MSPTTKVERVPRLLSVQATDGGVQIDATLHDLAWCLGCLELAADLLKEQHKKARQGNAVLTAPAGILNGLGAAK